MSGGTQRGADEGAVRRSRCSQRLWRLVRDCPNDLPQSCQADTSYKTSVAPIIQAHCLKCHAPGARKPPRTSPRTRNVSGQKGPILTQFYFCRMPPEGEPRPTEPERLTFLGGSFALAQQLKEPNRCSCISIVALLAARASSSPAAAARAPAATTPAGELPERLAGPHLRPNVSVTSTGGDEVRPGFEPGASREGERHLDPATSPTPRRASHDGLNLGIRT